MSRRVLVSGGGIAGCCLAWWLDRYGYEVTLVEKAEAPRQGGYVIDFWGPGYEVAARMGVLAALKAHDLAIAELRIVDRQGRRVSGFDQTALRDLTHGRLISLPRSSLALCLYDAVKDRVATRFGDSIDEISQDADGVDIGFRSGDRARYDLVLGADGLHSPVRALVFGEDARFERFLGYYAAAFTAPGYPHRDPHVYLMSGRPGRQMGRITLNSAASVFLLLFSADRLDIGAHDIAAQTAELRRVFSGAGGEEVQMLGALEASTDLYFDRMSQIVMPQWSHGRVALLGDACACPSLLAGEGSSMAMAEAYILAGELHANDGDPQKAFQAYGQRLRPFVRKKQAAARGFAASFVPKDAFGLWLRNTSLDLINGLHLSRLAFRAQVRDTLPLGTY